MVEHESFRGAARSLGVSASSVTRAVAALEQSLGVRLLERTSRTLALTPEGERYYESCRAALDAVLHARSAISQQGIPRGPLHVTAPLAFGQSKLLDCLPAFLEAYPAIELSVDLSDVYRDFVTENVDVAIRVGNPRDSDLGRRVLGHSRFALVASASYLKRFGRPKMVEDLRDHRCLFYETIHRIRRRWIFRNGSFALTPFVTLNNGPALVQLATQGVGLLQAPSYLVDAALASNQLVEILPAESTEGPPIQALFRRQLITARVSAFLTFLAEHLG
ncbi:MAG: LysR family transcriptional regulator [Myxococcota bacterium]